MNDTLEILLRQGEELIFSSFDESDAWELGSLFVEKAQRGNLGISIDISTKDKILFHYSCPGTNPDNDQWIIRKKNLVNRFGHSSWYFGQKLIQDGTTLEERYCVSGNDYAAHGGCFPLAIEGSGIIGTITISGLPQEEDHTLVVSTITEFIHAKKLAYIRNAL
jgi:uncharacterized protein (UPF0303 family)